MKNQFFQKWIWVVGCLFLGTTCQQEDMDLSSKLESGDDGAFVSVSIQAVGTATRALSPGAGEAGDGSEAGMDQESKISDLTLFFFEKPEATENLNMVASTRHLAASIFFNSSEILATSPQKTTPKRVPGLKAGLYDVLAVTNAGDLASSFSTINTMQEICDYVLPAAWSQNGTDKPERFVMSSSTAVMVDLSSYTSFTEPAHIHVCVRRVAARIDVVPTIGAGATAVNHYLVKKDDQVTALVEIKKLKLINALSGGSFLMRRVADTPDGVTDYWGTEKVTAENLPANFILDPWMQQKTMANLSSKVFNLQGVQVYARSLYRNYLFDHFTWDDAVEIHSTGDASDPKGESYVLDYTMENTLRSDAQVNGYSTGVIYETQYKPTSLITYQASTCSNVNQANSAAGISFYVYHNNNYFCSSLEAVEFPYLKSPQPDDFFAINFTSDHTWADVARYADRILSRDILGYKAFLQGYLTGKDFSQQLTDEEGRNISWYTFKAALDNQSALKELGISYYIQGRCFYTYWIRHADNGLLDSGCMEFGIVRNNIYKLKVVSFSGIGDPLPYIADKTDPSTPDEESNIRMSVTVQPWDVIMHPEIIL